MVIKTQGIIIHNTRYKDNKYISKIYTKELGMITVSINVSHSKTGKIKMGHIMPLNLLELTVDQRESKTITYLQTMHSGYVYKSLHQNIIKNCIAQFMNELLYKCLKETTHDIELYEYIEEALKFLDNAEQVSSDFHLVFMLELSKYLGFFPHNNFDEITPYFDLVDGDFKSSQPNHPNYLDKELSYYLHSLLTVRFSDLTILKLHSRIRNELLNVLILFYKIHIPHFSDLKSIQILQETLHS